LSDEISGLGRKTERPQPNPAANLGEVRLTPLEGFVLSRVDGATSYEELGHVTGLGVDATIEVLRKLRREGLILNPGEKPPPRPFGRVRTRTGATGVGIGTLPVALLETHDDGTPVDQAEVDKWPGLDVETKARILRLHRKLKSLKPHELLGLSPGADVAMVKRAYFAASKEVHPDRFYGKDIGPYRDKLSDIFAQLTRAFEQLKK
jgi:hypothetical protein